MKFLVMFAVMISVLACSKNKPLKLVPEQQKGGSVGPFDLTLSGEGGEKPNTFSAQINQPDGAVDFFLANGEVVQYLQLKSYTSSVAGCNPAAVEIFPLWYSAENSETYDVLSSGKTMMTTPRARSKLRVAFRGLQGCSQLNFSMVVQKLDVGPLQLSVEERLRGVWNYSAADGSVMRLDISPSRTEWAEMRGGRYTCDSLSSPLNSTSAEGGWLVFDRGNLLCQYRFVAGGSSAMDVICHGTPAYGCTLPASFRFIRN